MNFFLGSLFLLIFFNFSGTNVESLEIEVGLKPNYTSIHLNVSYINNGRPQEIYNGVIKRYYQFVDTIVNLILPDALPDALFEIGPEETLFSHTWNCVWAYRRLLIFVIILIIQIVFLICSSMQICCSCFSFCTTRYTLLPPKSNSRFSKWLWLTWLYATLSFLLLMLVFANQTNQNMDAGVNKVILTLDDVVEDIGTYMDSTIKQLEILLLTNLEEYFNFFLLSGQRATSKILNDLVKTITSLNFSEILNKIVGNFLDLKSYFDEIEAILTQVEELGKTINKEISDLKHLVENMVCSTKECEKLKKLIPSLDSIYDGGMSVANETYAELEDLHRQGKETLNKGVEEVGNLTSSIGGEALKEGVALGKLTSKVAGNVANLTSDIGGKVQNLTTNIAGHAIKEIENTGKDIKNLTGNIIGGIEGVAGGIGKEINNGGKAVGGVVTDVGNVAGGIVDEVGDTLKDHDDSAGSEERKKTSKSINPTTPKTTKKNKKPDIIDNVASGIGSIFDGPSKVAKITVAPVIETKAPPEITTPIPVKNETTHIVDSFGSSVPNKKGNIEESTMDLTSYLNEDTADKNNNKQLMDISSTTTTTKKPTTTTTKPVEKRTEKGVIEKVQNVASDVAGGIADTANEVGNGILGGFKRKRRSTNDIIEKLAQKYDNKSVHQEIKEDCKGSSGDVGTTSDSKTLVSKGEDKIEEPLDDLTSNVMIGIQKLDFNVENTSDAHKKLLKMGEIFFRKKREAKHDLDLKKEFELIFGTIDKIEKFVLHDLPSLHNISGLLSPVIKEIELVIKDGLIEIKNELEEAAKPIEKTFASALDKIHSIEKSILNATNVMKDAQNILSWFESYRYHISNFIAAALLISFILLIVTIGIRMVCNNATTKFTYKGGFTLLHLAALLMAITSLVYIGAGVTSQKVLCDTLDTNQRENNIMRILSSINPAEYGLILDLNLHKVIIRCHQDKSLYEVTALKSILNLEKIAQEFLDTKSIEKEFEPLIGLKLNFSRFLPFDIIKTLDVDLNFDVFDKILDSPIFSQFEQLEKEFTNIPSVGTIIKSISDDLDIFKAKVKSLRAPVKSAHEGFTSFFSDLKGLLTKVENIISEIEKQTLNTIQNVVLQIKNLLLSTLTDYVHNRLVYSIEKKVGKCRPISAAFNTTLNSVCKRITTPANGHWFSWFIGVFIAIILIVLSRIVDGKLNKSEKGDKMTPNKEEIELKTIDGSAGKERNTEA